MKIHSQKDADTMPRGAPPKEEDKKENILKCNISKDKKIPGHTTEVTIATILHNYHYFWYEKADLVKLYHL